MTQKKLTKPVITLDQPSFETWRKELNFLGLQISSNTYELQLPQLSAHENKELSIRINTLISECGCKVGGLAMSIMCCSSICYYFISGGRLNEIGISQVGSLLAYTALGALAGKTIALAHARWKLIRLANNIHRRITWSIFKNQFITNHQHYGTNL